MNKLRNNEIKMLFSLFPSYHTPLRGVPRSISLFLFRKIYIHISETLRRSAHNGRRSTNPTRCDSFPRDMSGRYASRALSSAEKSVENTKISRNEARWRRAYRANQRATISIMAEGGGSSGRDRRVHRDGRPLRRLHRPDCSGAFPRSRKSGRRDAARRGHLERCQFVSSRPR